MQKWVSRTFRYVRKLLGAAGWQSGVVPVHARGLVAKPRRRTLQPYEHTTNSKHIVKTILPPVLILQEAKTVIVLDSTLVSML
jgi:hypothetical protein